MSDNATFVWVIGIMVIFFSVFIFAMHSKNEIEVYEKCVKISSSMAQKCMEIVYGKESNPG